MALYLYRCEACEAEFDVWRSMSDDREVACESCEQPARRVYTNTPRIWKNPRGEHMRPPGSEWVGGDTYDVRTFHRDNPNARRRK